MILIVMSNRKMKKKAVIRTATSAASLSSGYGIQSIMSRAKKEAIAVPF